MNAKIYDAAGSLSDEERKRDRGAFFGSIHNVLNHLLVADRIWLGRLQERTPEPGFMAVGGIKSLDQELASNFDELRRERETTDGVIETVASELTAEALAGQLRMLRRGQWQEIPRWWAVTQMFNHQTHHRGQISTLLFQTGKDIGVTDIFGMWMEESAAAQR